MFSHIEPSFSTYDSFEDDAPLIIVLEKLKDVRHIVSKRKDDCNEIVEASDAKPKTKRQNVAFMMQNLLINHE